jgi:hypothetical protein
MRESAQQEVEAFPLMDAAAGILLHKSRAESSI